MEEGDTIGEPINPLSGEIDSNFAGLEAEKKKKLLNKILIWTGIGVGVVILVTVIIVLALQGGSEKKENKEEEQDNVPPGVYGNITAVYDLTSGEFDILSDEFSDENKNNLIIYVGNQKIKFAKKYNFDIYDSKTLRFEIHQKEFSMLNMFKNVKTIKQIIISSSNKEGRIISMESAFEQCSKLEKFNFNLGYDTTQLTSMKKTFA